jgi:hypothetical protein
MKNAVVLIPLSTCDVRCRMCQTVCETFDVCELVFVLIMAFMYLL